VKQIAVACFSGEPPPQLAEAAAKFVGVLSEKLGKSFALLVGGYYGAMKVVVDEAIKRGVPVVIVLPVEEEHRELPHEAIVIRTGMSYRLRSGLMVRSADAVVVLGGASGSMVEALVGYTESKPVLVLRTGMDTDRLEHLSPYPDARRLSRIEVFSDVEALASRLVEVLSGVGR